MPYYPVYPFGIWPTYHYVSSQPDILSAAVARLRDSNDFLLLIGEIGSVKKIWTDAVMGDPPLPYLVFLEQDADREYSSEQNYIETGQHQIDIYASSKTVAKEIREFARALLLDAPLTFDDGNLMKYRPKTRTASPVSDVGPGVPAVYHQILMIDYMLSGAN